MGQFTELKAADGKAIPAYVAQPGGKAKGGIVVIQEIFGVNSHIRSIADGYAAEGYLAVAPAIFHRVQPDVELGYEQADMTAGMGLKSAVEALPAPGVMQDIEAAIRHASQAGKVGIVGPQRVIDAFRAFCDQEDVTLWEGLERLLQERGKGSG